MDSLQAALDMTVWDIFIESADNLDQLTETVSDYINFCVQLTIPSRTIKIFANNKPWITPEIKGMINKKKQVFGKGNRVELRSVQKELDIAIRNQRHIYKQKVEAHFTENNMKRVWHGMRMMSGYSNGSNKTCPLPKSTPQYANELNDFYNRFDCHDFSLQTAELVNILKSNHIEKPFLEVSEEEVRKEFKRLKPSKAAGPDELSPRVIKNCAEQLTPIFTFIVNSSLALQHVPKLWKLSSIIPVP